MQRKIGSTVLCLLFALGVVGYPTWHAAQHPFASGTPRGCVAACADRHGTVAVPTDGHGAQDGQSRPAVGRNANPFQGERHDAAHCWLCQSATMPLQAALLGVAAITTESVLETSVIVPPAPPDCRDASGVPYSCGPPA